MRISKVSLTAVQTINDPLRQNATQSRDEISLFCFDFSLPNHCVRNENILLQKPRYLYRRTCIAYTCTLNTTNAETILPRNLSLEIIAGMYMTHSKKSK